MKVENNNKLTIKQRIFSGTMWTLFGFGAAQVIKLASTLILAKMLSPGDYGLVAIVNVILIGISMCSDFGFGANVMQNKRGEDVSFLNSIWTLQIVKGVLVWLVCILLAWPVSIFYEQQILLPLMIVITFSAVLAGLNSSAIFLTDRRIELKKQTFYQLTSQFVALVTMIGVAYYYPSVWVLVIGTIISTGLYTYFSHKLLPVKVSWHWDPQTNWSIIHFGKWIAVSSAMGFVFTQSAPLILGKFLTISQLGLYSLGVTMARVFEGVHIMLLQKIVTPTVAHFKSHSNSEVRARLLKLKAVLIGLFLPCFVLLIIFSPEIIDLIFDERYAGAAWIMQLYCLTYIPVIISGLGTFYLALGDSKLLANLTFFKTVSFFVLVVLGYLFNKGNGIILAVCLYNTWSYFIELYAQIKYKLWFPLVDLAALVIALLLLWIGFQTTGNASELINNTIPSAWL